MGRINKANLKKTIYYLRRNGIKNTWYATLERLEERKDASYSFVPVSEEEKQKQREWSADKNIRFSIVVPTYRTNEIYLREMLQSVTEQTYPHWELILADATEDDSVQNAVETFLNAENEPDKAADNKITCDISKVKYIKLTENAGISANTNQALQHVTGDYVGLLDHDDVLTADALYEMASRIENGRKEGFDLQVLFSDEDKCNGDGTQYYEPHFKENFNLDLLLSNNYICHFLVMKSELIMELGFRPEYDGAQDYDLVLRAARKLGMESMVPMSNLLLHPENLIVHVSKVLYHWRCHTGSTAENPQSKQYAYDAGLRALQDFSDQMGYGAKALPLKHLGFYTLKYPEGPLMARKELGAVGGSVLERGKVPGNQKIAGGKMQWSGSVCFAGLPAVFSGYMHKATLTQNAEAVDIRCIQVREECRDLFEKVVGVTYKEVEHALIFDVSVLPENTDYKEISLKLCKALADAGYGILYSPALSVSR